MSECLLVMQLQLPIYYLASYTAVLVAIILFYTVRKTFYHFMNQPLISLAMHVYYAAMKLYNTKSIFIAETVGMFLSLW